MTGDDLQLKPHHFALARDLISLLAERFDLQNCSRYVIGIGGESGSGKSVTATCLRLELERAGFGTAILHQDDYFRLPPRTNHLRRLGSLQVVGPGEVDLASMESDIGLFAAGGEVLDTPLVDYPKNLISRQSIDVSEKRILIAEGTYALGLQGLDVRVFLSRTFVETREQRLARNRDPSELDPIVEEILAIESKFVRSHAGLADITVDRDYRATIGPIPEDS